MKFFKRKKQQMPQRPEALSYTDAKVLFNRLARHLSIRLRQEIKYEERIDIVLRCGSLIKLTRRDYEYYDSNGKKVVISDEQCAMKTVVSKKPLSVESSITIRHDKGDGLFGQILRESYADQDPFHKEIIAEEFES